MEKRTYIQPKCEAMIWPKDAIMTGIDLGGSGTMATVGNNAPTRLAPANPALATDSVAVF